jgi:hypothetical protein
VVIVCRDAEAAGRAFGIESGLGIVYTRAGQRPLADAAREEETLGQLRHALSAAGFWERFQTGWVCLDAELRAGPDGGRLALLHLLATEGTAHVDKGLSWHQEQLTELAGPGGEVLVPASLPVDLGDAASVQHGVRWWEELTSNGAAGVLVRPIDLVARGARGLVQPAIACRGPAQLGQATEPEHLRRREAAFRRGVALRQFALGIEALERFVRREPLVRVRECCQAILALDAESAEPRQ